MPDRQIAEMKSEISRYQKVIELREYELELDAWTLKDHFRKAILAIIGT